MLSLRRTLAVRFSFTIFIALLFIALWAYLGAQRILREELDRSLAAVAQLEFAVIGAGFPIALHAEPADFEGFVEVVNRFVVVRDTDSNVLALNTPLARGLPLDARSFNDASSGRQVWRTDDGGEHQVRSYYGSWSRSLPRWVHLSTPTGKCCSCCSVRCCSARQHPRWERVGSQHQA